jgi:hypothetical protein
MAGGRLNRPPASSGFLPNSRRNAPRRIESIAAALRRCGKAYLDPKVLRAIVRPSLRQPLPEFPLCAFVPSRAPKPFVALGGPRALLHD